MNYDSSKLKTVADCDTTLDDLQKEKAALEYRKTGLTFRQSNFAENSDEVEQNLAVVSAELETVTSLLATIPEGPRKEKLITDKMTLESRQRRLQQSSLKYVDVVDFLRDVDVGQAEGQIAEIDKALALAEERKTVLAAA